MGCNKRLAGSEFIRVGAQARSKIGKAVLLQGDEIFTDSFGRLLQERSLSACRRADVYRILPVQAAEEIIGTLRRDTIRREGSGRKMLTVQRHDPGRAGLNSRREDMSVVRVGQGQSGDTVAVIFHQAILRIRIHQAACPFQLLPGEVRAICQNIAYPLVVDIGCPAGLKHASDGKMHEQIAQRCGIKDAGI